MMSSSLHNHVDDGIEKYCLNSECPGTQARPDFRCSSIWQVPFFICVSERLMPGETVQMPAAGALARLCGCVGSSGLSLHV